MNFAELPPDEVNLASKSQPFYLVCSAPLSTHEWRKLCALCSALNQMGYESYAHVGKTDGHFWAPLLSTKIQEAHYLAGKKPIVLNLGLAKNSPLGFGIQSNIFWGIYPKPEQVKQLADLVHVYVHGQAMAGSYRRFHFPLPELALLSVSPASGPRFKSLLYMRHYSGGIDLKWQNFERVEVDFSDKLDQLARQLQDAKWLYLYEWSDLAVLARWLGCPVVLIPNEQCLAQRSEWIDEWGVEGLAWGVSPDQLAFATATVGSFANSYKAKVAHWRVELQSMIDDTQLRANDAEFEVVWPQSGVDTLPELFTEPDLQSARADRLKWVRLHEQYDKWLERSSLREIDAQIYAEHLMSGELTPVSVVIDHHGTSLDQLADTLDSLSAAFGSASWVAILSDSPAPEAFEANPMLAWLDTSVKSVVSELSRAISTPWTLVVRAGTVLAKNALLEWMLAAKLNPDAKIIYADEDVRHQGNAGAYPHFKPDINVEMLRCTNYLGEALLVKSKDWLTLGLPLFDGAMYGAGLEILARHGKAAFGHIDTILLHSNSELSATVENAEFLAAKRVLEANHPGAALTPLPRLGTWHLRYVPLSHQAVSLVIPTGLQTGYLGSLLKSIQRYQSMLLDDVVLVCHESQRTEVELVVNGMGIRSVRLVTSVLSPYNHARALNEGVKQARHEFVLIADDDTELLQVDSVMPLLGIVAQPDVGCVAPRLVASQEANPKVVAGPVILGVGGTAGSYTGESQGLAEIGVYSRLQISQDVSTVAGHFFVMKRADWELVGGFDESSFEVFNSVLDFCLRLDAVGRRHVWTPMANVLHQGGKTLEMRRRNISQKIALAEQEVAERHALHGRWAKQLAYDRNYNRHLSLMTPFDIEADIVVDWQPKRHDRPRVLALPMHSGAGQYRVVEPLNALQDAGLAQSMVILPFASTRIRLLQPLELVRAAPDRLILQHSVDDGQLSLIDGFKNAAPEIKIIQTVDDLLGEVSEKHPNRQFQIREGHSRMKQALSKSARLIVTTQPLAAHYQKYVSDVHIVPNALGAQWLGLRKTPKTRKRLRVGWVGAGQHQGDLELINAVVRELASKVDWIFMGMCTEEMKSLLKEFHGYVSIADYPRVMSELDLDIAIAPLEDNFFNQCKSNLRLLEYGAMGWPVVCSDVYPYQTGNPPVLRVKNDTAAWVQGIETLFDSQARHAKAEALHQWVMSRYRLEIKTKDWFQAIFE